MMYANTSGMFDGLQQSCCMSGMSPVVDAYDLLNSPLTESQKDVFDAVEHAGFWSMSPAVGDLQNYNWKEQQAYITDLRRVIQADMIKASDSADPLQATSWATYWKKPPTWKEVKPGNGAKEVALRLWAAAQIPAFVAAVILERGSANLAAKQAQKKKILSYALQSGAGYTNAPGKGLPPAIQPQVLQQGGSAASFAKQPQATVSVPTGKGYQATVVVPTSVKVAVPTPTPTSTSTTSTTSTTTDQTGGGWEPGQGGGGGDMGPEQGVTETDTKPPVVEAAPPAAKKSSALPLVAALGALAYFLSR